MRKEPIDIRDLLSSCPAAGEGVHDWLFWAGLRLHRWGIESNDIEQLLRDATTTCGREVSDHEITEAARNSGLASGGLLPRENNPKWPPLNQVRKNELLANPCSLEALRKMSPAKFPDGPPQTENIIDLLFPGNPLLCVGRSQCLVRTDFRENLRGGLAEMQFIVPTPMTSQWGKTKGAGKRSMRTLENTGPRRFQVIEFDQGDFDEQSTLLLHLTKYAQLALVVHSGRRSLHGWYFCAHTTEERQQQFMRYAVSLGADSATWKRVQLVRMPDGKRDGETRQTVHFFNPTVLEVK